MPGLPGQLEEHCLEEGGAVIGNGAVVLSEGAPSLEPLAAATGVFAYLWLLIALPLLGAAVLLVGGRRTNRWGPYLGVLTVSLAAVFAIVLVVSLLGLPADDRAVGQTLFEWVFVGGFTVPAALQLDQLSMVFVLLITIVGALIHVYSLGYMEDDPDRRKFFGFLNLFIAAMLLLVLADNYLLLYVGWEGVGLASYLLIGFWQFKPSAAAAAKKAFIMNRVGDVGLSLAIMLIFITFGTVTFDSVFAAAGEANESTLTWIGLLLLLAACGKSAQFPLQAWLLDAMEGPTPVSALIHAATMVTAGVYLIVRSNPIYDGTAFALTAVVIIGIITMFLGAIIGSAKDDIIHAAFEQNIIIGICGVLAAGITGFYMTRMVIMTFFGKPRWPDDAHPHESKPVMTIPLIILGIGSVVTGAALLYWGNIESWLEPVTGIEEKPLAIPTIVLEGITLLIVLIGVSIAIARYRREVPVLAPKGNLLTVAARNSLYDDAINEALVVKPTYVLSDGSIFVDERIIDGTVEGSAHLVGGLGARLRRLQSGFARSYALLMVGGAVMVLVILYLARLP